ncbi:MAG: hypothetical protein AAFN12_04505 [Cyanobacteria bacterium J06560_2]
MKQLKVGDVYAIALLLAGTMFANTSAFVDSELGNQAFCSAAGILWILAAVMGGVPSEKMNIGSVFSVMIAVMGLFIIFTWGNF